MIRPFHLLCLALWLPAFALAQTAPSAAPEDAARANASTHFRRGVELFEEEAFRSALVEFQRAYELAPDYRVLYNIGQAQLRIQDYLAAIHSYERYLSEGQSAIAPERRAQVEQALTSLRERVGSIHVSVNRTGADVFLDDVKVGTSPLRTPLDANVGRYRVMARAPDGSTDARMVDVIGGESTAVALELSPPLLRVDANVAAPSRRSGRRAGAIASWSAGALLLAGSAATGAFAVRANHDLDKLLKRADVSHSEVSDKRRAVRTLALSTDILIGAGAAAVVLGTLLWIFDGSELRAPAARARRRAAALADLRLDVGWSGLNVSGRY